MCVDLLSARVAIDTPTPLCINKENYEEGVIYFVSFNDGTMIFHEGALAGFDVDEYTPLGSEHTKKYKIYWGNKDGKFWKKYVGGGVRIYYFDVNKESKKKYDNIIKSIRIRKLWRP